jgi:DNA-binding response OmpR family regulator
MRAHPEPIGYHMPASRPLVDAPPAAPPAVLFAVAAQDRDVFAGNQYTRLYVHTTGDALRLIATSRPQLVVIDCDESSLDADEICAAARASSRTRILITTADVAKVPKLLKAGCEAVLLKPFVPNLLAARIGRVIKDTERAYGQRNASSEPSSGTNRVWAHTTCPTCGVNGAMSFDYFSYRRMWYACLSCDATWLGPRQE